MNSLEKSLREERLKKNPKNPSFSSSLLDEIYRSIDGGGGDGVGDGDGGKEKVVKNKQSITQNIGNNGGGGRATSSSVVEDEEMARLRRASLVEKWMEMKVNEKAGRRTSSLPEFDRRSVVVDNDPMFFSSSSSYSDSSSGWGPETDQAAQPPKLPKTGASCFGTFKPPKPIRTTSVLPRSKQNEFYLFDHCYEYYDEQTNKTNEDLIKSKTRAFKIYSNLKKMKQPISPGGRLTAFLNSLFATGKATKDLNSQQEIISERKSNPTQQGPRATCSSASSFSRSCLSKTTSPRSTTREKSKRVRFYPVSVIVDEESRPCGQKTINIGRNDALESRYRALAAEKNGNAQVTARNYHRRNMGVEDNEDDEDMSSDSSSDLFELDHLASFSNDNRFCEELPVYETTHLGSVFIR